MARRKVKRELERNTNYFFEFLKIQKHFFKEMNKWLKVKDHRHKSYVKYPPEVILIMVILKNLCNLEAMRNMTDNFNKDECIENIRQLLGLEELEELPHYDTINDFLTGLKPSELEKIRAYMIKELLKKRCFEGYRINNKYWGVIVDGTGLYKFDDKHCEHCLKREYTNKETGATKTIYMHHVLEAKLVVGDMVFSMGSEFIENESEDVPKQDCEIKAFYRLAEKIKRTYKRLPICILGDSLYPCEPVFKICDDNHWKYLFRFKEDRIKSIATEFKTVKSLEKNDENNDICWFNDIVYNKRTVNMFECTIELKDDSKRHYVFVTDIKVTKRNAQHLVDMGRSRWKIENQGFNNQKNIRYNIEHANSHDYTAMKNHYLLTQIADILMQLYENGSTIIKTINKTAKEISSNLLEAIRTRRLTAEDITQVVNPMQIRFT